MDLWKKAVDVNYLDSSKTFNTVSHSHPYPSLDVMFWIRTHLKSKKKWLDSWV